MLEGAIPKQLRRIWCRRMENKRSKVWTWCFSGYYGGSFVFNKISHPLPSCEMGNTVKINKLSNRLTDCPLCPHTPCNQVWTSSVPPTTVIKIQQVPTLDTPHPPHASLNQYSEGGDCLANCPPTQVYYTGTLGTTLHPKFKMDKNEHLSNFDVASRQNFAVSRL